jgi:hypothetical protein
MWPGRLVVVPNMVVLHALVQKRLSLAHQNSLSLAHLGSSAVMLTVGECYSAPGKKKITASAFGMCAGDNILSLAN